MPRESIKHTGFDAQPGTDGGEYPGTPHQLSVGWSRGLGYVQVATERVDPTLPLAGHWVDLDRDGINRLIRLLRKARDQAYGADA